MPERNNKKLEFRKFEHEPGNPGSVMIGFEPEPAKTFDVLTEGSPRVMDQRRTVEYLTQIEGILRRNDVPPEIRAKLERYLESKKNSKRSAFEVSL